MKKKYKKYPIVTQKAYLKKNLKNVCKLDWNETQFNISNIVKKKLINDIKNNSNLFNWYPQIRSEKLLKKLSIFTKVNSKQICLLSGSDHGLSFIFRALTENTNQTVGLLSPTYDQARLEIELAGLKVIKIFFKDNFKNNNLVHQNEFETLIKKINNLKKCKIIYLCNPNNPTGVYLSNKQVLHLLKKFPKINFVVDEAYIEYTNLKSCSRILYSSKIKNLIILRTFSKAFCLAGLRFGYLLANEKNINLLEKYKNQKTVNSFVQNAAIYTLEEIKYYKKNINICNSIKNTTINKIKNFGYEVVNTPCNFFLIKINNTKNMINYLEKQNIFVRSLDHLDKMKGYLRVTVGKEDQMNYLIKNLKKSKIY